MCSSSTSAIAGKKPLLAAVTLLLVLLPAGCFADETDIKSAGTVQLTELVPNILLAYGGKDALAQLDRNAIMIGEEVVTADDESSAASKFREVRKNDELRIDVEPGENLPTVSTVFDGMSAWKATGKIVQELSKDDARLFAAERDHSPSVMAHYDDPAYGFKLLGRTTFHATPAYAIEVSKNGDQIETLYVDEKNFLVLALSYSGKSPKNGSSAVVTREFSEYRPASATVFPFKQIDTVSDKPFSELKFTSVDTNTPVEEAQFKRPDRAGEVRLGKQIILPFEYSHKEIIVKASINGSTPLDFLFDSAASQTVIDRGTAAATFLDKQGQFNVTAAGGAVASQLTTIQKLSLGEVDMNDVPALILDLAPQARQMGKRIDGIIGENVLNKFAVTIDFPKQQIVLSDANTYKPPAGASIVSFSQKQGPLIKATLNGNTETTFLIDTGAAFNNIPSKIASKFLAGQTPHTTEGTGLDGRPVKLAEISINNVKVGTQTIRGVNFTYSVEQDQTSPAKGFVQAGTAGVLGNPFWQNFAMTLDYKFQRLVLQPNNVLTGRGEIDSLISTGDSKLVIYRDLRAAEAAYEKALLKAQSLGDAKLQARIWGRIGALRRVMAKDLSRPEQARIAYEYFSKAQELAHKLQDRETEGRVLADWSLLYLDNNQAQAALQALQGAALYSPQDPQVSVNFAVYLFKMGNYAEMQKYVEKALFLDPSNWQALWYKVKLAEMFSDQQQLKDTLKEIARIYPWSKLAKDKLAALSPPPMIAPTANPAAATSIPGVQQIVPTPRRGINQ